MEKFQDNEIPWFHFNCIPLGDAAFLNFLFLFHMLYFLGTATLWNSGHRTNV